MEWKYVQKKWKYGQKMEMRTKKNENVEKEGTWKIWKYGTERWIYTRQKNKDNIII